MTPQLEFFLFFKLPQTLFNPADLTSAQLRILFFCVTLLVILGSGAPVALLLQNMADYHPQQTQEEENWDQDEGDVVWVPTGFILFC